MWGLVIAGIGAGASLFNAIDEATSNRAIREKLDKLIGYITDLDRKVDVIHAQNLEILERLDALPKVVRAIVQEIVDEALLDERYASLHAIKLNITKLRLDREYRITAPGWRDLSSALTYVFMYENRISYLFRLILASELALGATRNYASPFIVSLLKQKIALLDALRDDYVARIEIDLQILKTLLDNTQYIASHNLSDDLAKFEELAFQKQPDRLRTVHYTVQECRTRVGHCGEVYDICRDVPRTREEPDTPFHTARDNHVAAVNLQIPVIAEKLSFLANLSGVIERFKNYLHRVSDLAVSSNEVVLFHQFSGAIPMAEGLAALSQEEEETYSDYYDGVPIITTALKAERVVPEVDGAFEVVLFRCPPT